MHKYKILATLILAAFIAVGCDSSSSTAPEEKSSSSLRGTVLHDNGKPYVGLNVKLKAKNQTTKTDANGKWSFPTSSAPVAGRTQGALDSVVVSTDSQVVTAQPVSSYDAELPPLYIVQRDLNGSLANFRDGNYTVTAYLTFPDSTTKVIPLWHNTVAHAFSGFIYTVYTAQTVNYSVRVIVRDTTDGDSTITGLSPTVPFNSTAGDVTIPVFSYRNITPAASLSVTGSVKINSEVTINATVGDTDVVNGYMTVDNTKNLIYWKRGSAGSWTLGTKSLTVKIDTSVLRDSCFSVKVIDDQDSLVTTNQYCFDLSASAINQSAVRFTVWSINYIASWSRGDTTTGDSVNKVGRDWDSINVGNRYTQNGRLNVGDTINLGALNKTNTVRYDSVHWWRMPDSGIEVTNDTTLVAKNALTYVSLDSTNIAGASAIKWLLWSEKAAVIAFYGDTIALKSGDNVIVTNKTVVDTSSIALRLIPGIVWRSRDIELKANLAYYIKYGNYLYGKYTLADLPKGTYANGLLKLDNTNANDGKFVIKSIVGYK